MKSIASDEPLDFLAAEFLEKADTQYEFDINAWKFRCAACSRVMRGSLAQVRNLIKLYRQKVTLETWTQKHFTLPFIDVTITLWKKDKPR